MRNGFRLGKEHEKLWRNRARLRYHPSSRMSEVLFVFCFSAVSFCLFSDSSHCFSIQTWRYVIYSICLCDVMAYLRDNFWNFYSLFTPTHLIVKRRGVTWRYISLNFSFKLFLKWHIWFEYAWLSHLFLIFSLNNSKLPCLIVYLFIYLFLSSVIAKVFRNYL